MADRKFEKDKVYLQGPDGVIWDYDNLLANVPGYNAVTPNPSKPAKAATTQEDAAKTEAETNAKK